MPAPSPCQPRLFLIGYARGYRLELTAAFRDEGFHVLAFEDARVAAQVLTHTCADTALLNWAGSSAPLTSLEFVERYGGLFPVLILTAHNVLFDVVHCLRAGAADYIRLPCYFPELLARVQRAQTASPKLEQLTVGEFALDVQAGVVRIGGAAVSLTEREARLLAALLRCPGHPLSRDVLLRAAGVTGVQPTILESHLKNLRKKHPLLRRCLRTKYGHGYGFFETPKIRVRALAPAPASRGGPGPN